jgi:hypothetical protein
MGSGTLKASCFWSKRVKRILLAGCALIALVGCSPKPQTLKGTLAILANSKTPVAYSAVREEYGGECSGSSAVGEQALGDIKAGSQVVVKDASGKVLSTGALGAGSVADLSAVGACSFPFSVANVPATDFYSIEVVGHPGMTLSEKTLKASNWTVKLEMSSSAPVVADASNLAPATEKDKKVRKLSAEMEEGLSRIATAQEDAKRESDKTETCIAQEQLTHYQGEASLSIDCERRLERLKEGR